MTRRQWWSGCLVRLAEVETTPTPSDLDEIEEHLRGASDAVMVLQAEIGQLERHKRGVDREEEWARAAEIGASGPVRTIAEPVSEPPLAAFSAHQNR